MAARELPPRSFNAFSADLIISEYLGCDDPCADLPLVGFFAFFGDALAAATLGTDATGAVVLSVIVDGKF